ncbi:MAG: hypothetical protein Q7T18_12630 [Sedimentisphaerales bacterium]|nr:hypothetical protein [Sedimentisphaerales bacterium]
MSMTPKSAFSFASGLTPKSTYNFSSMIPKPTQLYENDLFRGAYNSKINAQNNAVYSSALARAKMAEQLMADYQRNFNEAKNTNEARYNEILQGFGGITGQINEAFTGLSNQGEKDIGQATLNSKAGNTQALVNSGMVGTTVLPSLNMQADNNGVSALNRLRDAISMGKLSYTTGNEKDKLAFMERREDTYPDAAMISNLLQQFGNFSDVAYTYS